MRNLFSAIGGLFAPTNEAPVPYVTSRNGNIFGSAENGVAGDRAFDAYSAVGTLFAIVRQLATAVSAVEWHLYKRTSTRDKKRRVEVLAHPFLKVWNAPNPFYTTSLLVETVQMHLDLVGEGMIILNRQGETIYEMWPVRPDRMTPVKDPAKFLLGWIYTSPDGEEIPLELRDVIQIKYPNPKDPYRGMGPVQTILNDIDAARYSADWNKNFFINGARPGGIIKFDYQMDDNQFKAFVNRWRSQHQGVANAHRVAILENAEWVDTAFSMTDMQFVEMRELSRELIREAFAFPKPMLGTVDDVNRANSDAAKEIMAESHTIPRCVRWRDIINTFLLPQFANGPTLVLDFDDPTPVNHEAADRERTSMSGAAQQLVMSGYHPDDVAEAVGLPAMRWVGLPAPGAVAPSETPGESEPVPTAPPQGSRALPKGFNGKPIVDVDFWEEVK